MAMGIFLRSAICFSLLLGMHVLPGMDRPLQAAHLPAADRPRSSLQLGSAPSLGLSWRASQRLEFGVSTAAPFFFAEDFGNLRYNLYTQYQLLNEKGFYMGIVGGVYGDLNLRGSANSYSPAYLQFGAALAYDLNRQLTLRLNIVPGISLLIPPDGWLFFPPVGGVALVWRPQSQWEASLGFNGNGDIAGLRYLF